MAKYRSSTRLSNLLVYYWQVPIGRSVSIPQTTKTNSRPPYLQLYYLLHTVIHNHPSQQTPKYSSAPAPYTIIPFYSYQATKLAAYCP